MSLLRRARKNIALKFATEAVIRLLALAFVIVVARSLGDQDYGKYALMIYMGGLLTVLSDLGLNTLLIREVSGITDCLPLTAATSFPCASCCRWEYSSFPQPSCPGWAIHGTWSC